MAELLLLEDDRELREEIADFLRAQGHVVREASCRKEFRALMADQVAEIAILDRRLPDGDGMDLIAEAQASGWHCGFVLLTARDAGLDRIAGYGMGADYYLTKPVNLDELAVILKTLTRRLHLDPDWRLNLALGLLRAPDGALVYLTGLEATFLAVLGGHPNQLLDRRQITQGMGKDYRSYDPRNLDALLRRLRKKVHDATGQDLPVQTRHGLGYVFLQPLTWEKG